jgi:ubiquinone/menaquinone biosynthesis C-methylase UbiE
MSAFDTLAPTYDNDFTQQAIGQILRARVHQRLLSHFSASQHVLEIGCGTGEDALFLAEQGITVTATDASEEMLSIAREKTNHQDNVIVEQFNIANLTPSPKSPSPNSRKGTCYP